MLQSTVGEARLLVVGVWVVWEGSQGEVTPG